MDFTLMPIRKKTPPSWILSIIAIYNEQITPEMNSSYLKPPKSRYYMSMCAIVL